MHKSCSYQLPVKIPTPPSGLFWPATTFFSPEKKDNFNYWMMFAVVTSLDCKKGRLNAIVVVDLTDTTE